MEDAGFKKKNGCFGLALLNSVIWSLERISALLYRLRRKGGNSRIIPANAHDLGSFFEGSH
jgi:hypothetical protein